MTTRLAPLFLPLLPVLALAACAPPPVLQGPRLEAAALPEPRLGDVLTWDAGYSETVAGLDGDRVEWRYANGATVTTYRNFLLPALAWDNPKSRAATRMAVDPRAMWPLKSGEEIRFRAVQRLTRKLTNSDYAFQDEWGCRNDGTEAVTVPLGRFDTFRLRCTLYAAGSIVEEYVWNYAPALGQVVRRKRPGEDKAEELVAYSRGALPAEAKALSDQALQRALETLPAAGVAEARGHGHRAEVTPVASFATERGVYCREFRARVEAGDATSLLAGVACRGADGRWKVPG